jgi:2-keto-4-pentenoate hydratase
MGGIIEQAASKLRAACETRQPIAPIRELIAADDSNGAYEIQELNVRHELGKGRRLSGRKIGLTSPAVRKQFGVFEPDYGALFADTEHGPNEEVSAGKLIQPRCEVEVALVLDRDLDHPGATFADIVRATAYVLPAIEIVDSRIAKWDIKLVDTIADNASFGRYVLGSTARHLDGLDLAGCRMRMTKNGEECSKGQGKDCMGHPLNAAAWLARTMYAKGSPLRAGDVVMTGALGPMVSALANDEFAAEVEGLGAVSVRFSA